MPCSSCSKGRWISWSATKSSKTHSAAIIGELALIDQSPRGATVIAHGPARLARVDQRRFHFFIQQNPFFATHVMKELADRLRQMNQLLAER